MSPSDDLIWYHLTPAGWSIARGFYAGEGGDGDEPPRGADCLKVVLFTSPNNGYSRASWETIWVSPDAAALADAIAQFGNKG